MTDYNTDKPNTLNDSVKLLLGQQYLVDVPKWEQIPTIATRLQSALLIGKATPMDALTVLEALFISFKAKIEIHLGDLRSDEIIRYGNKLVELDDLLFEAANQLILGESPKECVIRLSSVFTIIKETWNDLYAMGVFSES